jgi:PhnB protein
MALIQAYLTFAGNCAEAMTFYRDSLGGELTIMKADESPVAAQLPPELKGQVMHASLLQGDMVLFASDSLDGSPVSPGSNINLMLACSGEKELREAFAKMAVGAHVETEPKFEFWGALYGSLIDKYGIRWMFNWEPPQKA